LPRFKSGNALKQTLSVLGAAQQVGGFLKRLKVIERHHHNSLLAIASDDDRLVVAANAVHGVSQFGSGSAVSDSVHSGLQLYVYLYNKGGAASRAAPNNSFKPNFLRYIKAWQKNLPLLW